MTEQPSIFTTYARDLLAYEENSALALKDHPQIPLIIDILSRKQNHHALLTGTSSKKIQTSLLESIAFHLSEGNAPRALRDIDFIFLNAQQLSISNVTSEKITQDFTSFYNEKNSQNRRVILAINDLSDCFGNLIKTILTDENFRIILLSDETRAQFTTIKLTEPTDIQILTLLKTYKNELETFHHVLIPDETFISAMSMAAHYLPNYSYFDNVLELLDSAAARASSMERHEAKPIVTSMTLALVISNQTQIPLTHLHNNTFQANKLIESMQRKIFGQDSAIASIGLALQHACIKLQEKSGPLCNFLFAGLPEVGKASAAYAMTEHLFGHKKALLHINLEEAYQNISDIKIITDNKHSSSLLDAVQQTPYAIILIENIHLAPIATFNLFKNIFTYGYALDEKGNKYDFRHTIFIATTTLGSERIATLTQTPTAQDAAKNLDLLQLVLNEQTPTAPQVHTNLSAHELCEELLPTLENHFGNAALQYFHIVPFLPLDYPSLEKIIRMKVKILAKRLEANFGIELTYAPEVIKFLAHEALWRKASTKPLEKLLEQHLYSAVASEIFAHAEDKNRPKRLALQLNDDGQLLSCEFVSAMSATVYNL